MPASSVEALHSSSEFAGTIMKFIWTAFVSGSLLAMQPAAAENPSDSLDEVVVTAQRRAERLQDVPAAITAMSGDALNQMRLQGNADLAAYVPSLSFDVLGPGEPTLTIRGLALRTDSNQRYRFISTKLHSISAQTATPVRRTSISSTSIASRCCAGRRGPSTARVRWAERSGS